MGGEEGKEKTTGPQTQLLGVDQNDQNGVLKQIQSLIMVFLWADDGMVGGKEREFAMMKGLGIRTVTSRTDLY